MTKKLTIVFILLLSYSMSYAYFRCNRSRLYNVNTVGLSYTSGFSISRKEIHADSRTTWFQTGIHAGYAARFHFLISRQAGLGLGIGKSTLVFKQITEGYFLPTGLYGKQSYEHLVSYLDLPLSYSSFLARNIKLNAGYQPSFLLKHRENAEVFGGAGMEGNNRQQIFPNKIQHSASLGLEVMMQLCPQLFLTIQPSLTYSWNLMRGSSSQFDYRPWTPNISFSLQIGNIDWTVFTDLFYGWRENKPVNDPDLENRKKEIEEKIKIQINKP